MSRLLLLGILVYGLFLFGLATLSRGIIAFAIPLILYLGTALLYGPEEVRLRIRRSLSAHRVFQNAPVVVRLSVTNEGSWLEEVLVEDLVPPQLALQDGEPGILASLPPGRTVEFTYTVSGTRGEYGFSGVRAVASDCLGLFRRRRVFPLSDYLLILPEITKMRRLAIRPLRTHGFAGPVPARQAGPGVEFYGVREYQSGDPLRWINWRASARHYRALFTNEFEQERIADVGLILDARQRHDIRSKEGSLLEHAIQATASLAEIFLRDGNRVGLLIYGWFLDWTFPGYGKVQRERILRALSRARTGDSIVFETLDYLPVRFFPARSQIVVISPLCRDDLAILIRLKARGYEVLVVSPDPVSFEAKSLAPQPGVALATRIARLERTLLLRKLRRAGIRIVDWRVDKPLDQVIHASLGRGPHMMRALGGEP